MPLPGSAGDWTRPSKNKFDDRSIETSQTEIERERKKKKKKGKKINKWQSRTCEDCETILKRFAYT